MKTALGELAGTGEPIGRKGGGRMLTGAEVEEEEGKADNEEDAAASLVALGETAEMRTF